MIWGEFTVELRVSNENFTVDARYASTELLTGMFTRIIDVRRYFCHSMSNASQSSRQHKCFMLTKRHSSTEPTYLHLQINGNVIKDTLVTFNKAPFRAGKAKKKTSSRL